MLALERDPCAFVAPQWIMFDVGEKRSDIYAVEIFLMSTPPSRSPPDAPPPTTPPPLPTAPPPRPHVPRPTPPPQNPPLDCAVNPGDTCVIKNVHHTKNGICALANTRTITCTHACNALRNSTTVL